jgi:hypothetical protein
MLQAREEKRVIATDTKEIFARVASTHETLDYPGALSLLQDLAYIVVPFDKTEKEF